MVRHLVKIAAVIALILLPFGVRWLYLWVTAYPDEIVFATGAEQGRYRAISEALAKRIQAELEIQVRLIGTNGSLDNLRRLQRREVDFALYQPGTLEALEQHDPDFAAEVGSPSWPADRAPVAFVANIYSQPAHFIVRRGSGIESPADMKGKGHRVSIGLANSGDLAMSLVLLEHFGLDPQSDIEAKKDLNYAQIERLFQQGQLDAAFISVGVQAEVFQQIARMRECQLLSIPNVEALARNNLCVSPYTIPRGLYNFDLPVPEHDIQTVSSGAQLLSRADVPNRVVEAVTRRVHDKSFIKENRLWELYAQGSEFALQKPEFPIHAGARAFYEPKLRPLIDPDLVESTEGTISLACSLAIAVFFLFRWARDESAKRKGHKLDRFIRALLDIERRQMPLDETGGHGDIDELQKLLDDVTVLRQDALREFTAHQLNEDRGPECLIQMCHALSDKINAKLSRRQQDKLVHELIEAVNKRVASDA